MNNLKRDCTVLSIAAIDPSRGAGIYADLETIKDFGANAIGVSTAITFQNSQKFYGGKSFLKNDVIEQFKGLAPEYNYLNIDAIKIGAIPNDEILETVLDILKEYKETRTKANLESYIVWDPVASASAQDTSIKSQLSNISWQKYLPNILALTTVFTPNLKEALALSNYKFSPVHNIFDYLKNLQNLAKFFNNLGSQYVVIKGGHAFELGLCSQDTVPYNIDYLRCSTSEEAFLMSDEIFNNGIKVHGTGCALSAAIATNIATFKNYFDNILSGVVLAKSYVAQGINDTLHSINENIKVRQENQKNKDITDINVHYGCSRNSVSAKDLQKFLPYVAFNFNEVQYLLDKACFAKCPEKLGFYVVVDSSEWIERLCLAGVKTMQLRIKDPVKLADATFIRSEIEKSVALGKQYGALVFIDDLWEEAIKYGAYGVHLGQSDLNEANVKEIRNAGLRLGVSTHSYGELARGLLLKPSYIALGHIFPTNSKVMPSLPQGISNLRNYVETIGGRIPTVAIGGIKLENVKEVWQTGVSSVAVITAVTKAEDPEQTIRDWMNILV